MKSHKARILVIYTGGTIGMVKDPEDGTLKPFDFDHLVAQIPELKWLDCAISSISFAEPMDSSNMQPSHWVDLVDLLEVNHTQYDGFVVLHGSDTMSYTASALSFMVRGLAKPIIFTGSQLPIGDLRTDAKENLITAIQIAALHQDGVPVVQEVGLYFEYKLYRANRTTKVSASHFNAFASLNYPALVESGVHLEINHGYLWRSMLAAPVFHKRLDNRVGLLKLYPGMPQSLVRTVLLEADLSAVLIETFGAGNAPDVPWFHELIEAALAKNVLICHVTQCAGGGVLEDHYQTSLRYNHPEILSGRDLTTEAALAKLMVLLGCEIDPQELRSLWATSLCGEQNN
ncbi:MAG: asparaginase [Flavobacteriaceae bacterium]|nr:asparaginase [Flavobacteriaceae bacterium]MDP5112979.1 asparaginase [Flavobacteriaceae bacterium]